MDRRAGLRAVVKKKKKKKKKKKLFCHAGRYRDCPVHSQVTLLIELPCFLSG